MRYSDLIQDHFREPRNAGDLPSATHRATESNPVCGDFMTLALRIDRGTIENATFLAEGCIPTHAAGSLLTEALRGMTTAQAETLSLDAVLSLIGPVPPGKEHAAHLAVSALRAALRSPCTD